MDVVFQEACEPRRWTVVFHRKAANLFFSVIAMGHFKHVSAFCWVPECRVWVRYDVSFERTHIEVLPDTLESKLYLQRIIAGNCIVTLTARDAAPFVRLGLYCTTAIKHLLGLSGGALRPDALFRLCVRAGGTVSDDENTSQRATSHAAARAGRGPDAGDPEGAGPGR